jgi:hypothetical protein
MAQYINRNAPGSGLATLMAARGRRGDTELVHMTRPEVRRLEATGLLSLNPRTGLPEASAVSDYFKNMAKPRNLIPALIGALAAPIVGAIIPPQLFGDAAGLSGTLGRIASQGVRGALVSGAAAVPGWLSEDFAGHEGNPLQAAMIGGMTRAGLGALGEGQRYIRGVYDSNVKVPVGTERYQQYEQAKTQLPSDREIQELGMVTQGQEPGGMPGILYAGSDDYGLNEIQVDPPVVPQVAGTPSLEPPTVPIRTRADVIEALSRDALTQDQLRVLNLGPAEGEAWDKDYHLPEGSGLSPSTLAQIDLRTQQAREKGELSKYLRNVEGMTTGAWGPSIPELQQRALKGVEIDDDLLRYSPTAEDIVNAQASSIKFSDPSTYLEDYKTQSLYGIPQAIIGAYGAVAPSQFLDARAKAIREKEEARLAGIRSPEGYEQKDREYTAPALREDPPTLEEIYNRYYRGVQPDKGWGGRWYKPISGRNIYAKEGGLVSLQGGGAFEGRVEGRGHGMQDNVMMPIEGGGVAAVSPKEYVVPADVMAMLGNGNADDGSEKMDRFISKFRKTKYGRDRQPPEMDGSTALQSLIRV